MKNDDKHQSFDSFLEQVTPLGSKMPGQKVHHPVAQTEPVPNLASGTALSIQSDDAEPVGSNDVLCYKVSGLGAKQFKALKKGVLTVSATLDLHQHIVAQAAQRLDCFIAQSLSKKHKVVLVIHGRGLHSQTSYPILKSKVNQWLRQLPGVLAFCSAPEALGGTGAVLVMLTTKNT